jgi:hypothetical protein
LLVRGISNLQAHLRGKSAPDFTFLNKHRIAALPPSLGSGLRH